jgi:hypothetical protein
VMIVPTGGRRLSIGVGQTAPDREFAAIVGPDAERSEFSCEFSFPRFAAGPSRANRRGGVPRFAPL